LEIVQCVEERQQAQVGGSFQADQVRRVDDENTMEGESWRPRIDVSDPSQEKGAQELAIGDTAPQLFDQHLGAPVARRALNESYQRFDLGPERDSIRRDLGVGAG